MAPFLYKEGIMHSSDKFDNEVNKALEIIRGYPMDFKFTVNYASLPTRAKENGMRYVMDKAIALGYIKSVSIGHSLADLRGESGRFCTEETFIRL